MKKLTSKTLSDFIDDFGLAKPKGEAVCFNATIHFTTKFKSVQLQTEVQIVTSSLTQMSTIYLLHPDVIVHGIPEIIQDDKQLISYIPGKCLLVKGQMLIYVDYVLTIHPENSSCDEATLYELHAKKYN